MEKNSKILTIFTINFSNKQFIDIVQSTIQIEKKNYKVGSTFFI